MLAQRWMWIAWPAFLAAAVMEMLVFAFVDPLELHWLGDLGWSRQGIYTLAFFAFWGVTAAVQPHDHHAGTLHARSQRRRGLRAGPKSGHAGPGARLNLRALQWQ